MGFQVFFLLFKLFFGSFFVLLEFELKLLFGSFFIRQHDSDLNKSWSVNMYTTYGFHVVQDFIYILVLVILRQLLVLLRQILR